MRPRISLAAYIDANRLDCANRAGFRERFRPSVRVFRTMIGKRVSEVDQLDITAARQRDESGHELRLGLGAPPTP